jgi:spermidine synthase
MQKFLPTIASEFDNPKLEVIIADGISFVQNANEQEYDLVLVDGSDPVGPAKGLFSKKFFLNCKRILKERGILVAQGESPKFNESVFVELNTTFQEIFGVEKTKLSLFNVPSYPTGIWSFQWGVKGQIEPTLVNFSLVNDVSFIEDLKYYNEAIHGSSFALPNYVRKMIENKTIEKVYNEL